MKVNNSTIKNFLLLASVFASVSLAAQKDHLSFFAGVKQQDVAGRNQLGGEFQFKYYLTNNLALGAQLNYGYRNYHHFFGYITDYSRLTSSSVGALGQYDFLYLNRLELGAFLSAGLKTATLRNLNDITIEEQYDEYGQVSYVEVARKLDQDYFFSVTPGVTASYSMVQISKEEKVWLFLTLNAGYQQNFGRDDLQKLNNPHGFTASIGLTVKGYAKSQDEE